MITSADKRPARIEAAPPLPPVGVRATTTRFGFLLRHYWMPGATLLYRRDWKTRLPGGESVDHSCKETRFPLRCDADRVLWRQTLSGPDRVPFRLAPPQTEDILCEYDRSEQTFRTKPVLDHGFSPQDTDEARLLAFISLPILTPLLPIPLGFRWHVATESGVMNFELASLSTPEGTPVLTIRRHGEFRMNRYFRNGREYRLPLAVRRSGYTAYDLDRSVTLEDRFVDTIRCRDGAIDGAEIHGSLTLIESRPTEHRSPAPLIRRYGTDSGRGYLYDCGTGHIVDVDETVGAIADDWRVLSDEEIVRKYGDRKESELRNSILALDELQRQGLFPPHEARELSRVDRISRDGVESEAKEFWRNGSGVLILGVTERCNLCCEYCCYGGKFAGWRTHGSRSMTWETARQAIAPFLDGESVGDGTYPISFYGGEPLLELDLIKRCVEYAEKRAGSRGREIRFALTTNGTLLNDRVTDFLVEHRFLVLISLDGPREAHDRYRLFPNGEGSFGIVERNIERFVERHPGYKLRGFNMTLAPPLDLASAARFIERHIADYPLSRANLVNTGCEYRFSDRPESPTRYGCSSKAECKKRPVGGDPDPFRRFEPGDRDQLKRYWSEFVIGLKTDGATKSWSARPLHMMLFETQIAAYHRRSVSFREPLRTFFVPCIPGLTRRFCDVDGNYRVCERVDLADAYILGNVRDGLDTRKFERTMELRRHFGDCGNCEAIKFCDVCYARMPESDGEATGFDPQFDLQCQETRRMTLRMLKTYTEIMEANENAFDRPMEADHPNIKKILFGVREDRLEYGSSSET